MNDFRRFLGLAVLALLVAIATMKPQIAGDWIEYTATAVAVSLHGTPDIRLEDLRHAREVFDGWGQYERIAKAIEPPEGAPADWFFRARNGQIFTAHFFAYSGIVGLSMPLLKAVSLAPAKAFVLVHGMFVLFLALSLYRLFGSSGRATLGLVLFMLAGGAGYWSWTSPELVTAAAFLAALVLFLTDAPILAGLLAGIACMQNPPIALFVVFAPLLLMVANGKPDGSWLHQAKALLGRRHLAGLAITLACASLPVLFNEWAWGVPSIIVKTGTDPRFVSAGRLFSYFFDLNQGLVIGFPGVLAALLVAAARSARTAALSAVALLFTIALALPALTTGNWNSGAAGIMRYAFWGGMPLLFVLLLSLARAPRISPTWVALVLSVQAVASYAAIGYDSLHLSPGAKLVLGSFPAAYNPEPEIFAERVSHKEEPDTATAYVYTINGIPMKLLAHTRRGAIDNDVCGDGKRATGYTVSEIADGWRYFNGPFRCEER